MHTTFLYIFFLGSVFIAQNDGIGLPIAQNPNQDYPIIDYASQIANFKQDELNYFNLVVVGHVDSGKSTLIGHLLNLMKKIDEKIMRKIEKVRIIGKDLYLNSWKGFVFEFLQRFCVVRHCCFFHTFVRLIDLIFVRTFRLVVLIDILTLFSKKILLAISFSYSKVRAFDLISNCLIDNPTRHYKPSNMLLFDISIRILIIQLSKFFYKKVGQNNPVFIL